MKWTEERISEIENREIPNLNRKQTEKKNRLSLKDLWNYNKRSNIHVTGIPRRREERGSG